MATSKAYLILALLLIAGVRAAPVGRAITAAEIPATPAAALCKTNLDTAAAEFAIGGIAAVSQVPEATTSNYIYCMEYKPTAKDTAVFPLHLEPSYMNVPIGNLTSNPATPQVAGFITAGYQAGAGMVNNGDYGLATYSWDLNNKASANPATQKTSLLEMLSNLTGFYLCGCGIGSSPAPARRMLH